jgi:hypothetical protein
LTAPLFRQSTVPRPDGPFALTASDRRLLFKVAQVRHRFYVELVNQANNEVDHFVEVATIDNPTIGAHHKSGATGAHLHLQSRTRVSGGELEDVFRKRWPAFRQAQVAYGRLLYRPHKPG